MKTGQNTHHALATRLRDTSPAVYPPTTRTMLILALVWLACATGCSGEGTTEMPKESAGWLAGAYINRVDDRSWGLLEIEKAEKGRSYVSKGERDIRAGLTVEPTRVTFTGWGFSPESGQLEHYRVVSSWLCYTNDFGEPTGIPGQHEVTPIDGKIIKGKNLVDLGSLGMSPEQIERLCGPATKLVPSKVFEGATRLAYQKDSYDIICLFYAGRMFSTSFSRADHTFATSADKMIWLLQNGTTWTEDGRGGYKGPVNQVNASHFNLNDEQPAKQDYLQVLDDRLSPKGVAAAAQAAPLGRYQKSVKDLVGMLWYYRVQEEMDQLKAEESKVRFTVDADGHPNNIKVTSGDPDSALSKLSVAAVKDADIPPIPANVTAELHGKPLEIEIDFDTRGKHY